MYIEKARASVFYGRLSPGYVVVVNGTIYFHGTNHACDEFILELQKVKST